MFKKLRFERLKQIFISKWKVDVSPSGRVVLWVVCSLSVAIGYQVVSIYSEFVSFNTLSRSDLSSLTGFSGSTCDPSSQDHKSDV